MTPYESTAGPTARSDLRPRVAATIGLMLLSPFCAEMLIAYLGPITDPISFVVSLAIFAPLYGPPALLIREAARRTGRGWPTILLLAAAAGVVQAGLIDQSLFNHEFTDEIGTRASLSTVVPGVDVDLAQLLSYIGGHVIWSFAAPIAVVESCAPKIADRPWVSRRAIVIIAMLYAAAAVCYEHWLVVEPGFHASPWQLVGAAAVALALVVAAFAVPSRRSRGSRRALPRWTPPWWLAGMVAAVLLGAFVMVSDLAGWLGVAAAFATLLGLGLVVWWWSGAPGWGRRHVLALAGAALLVYAAASYLVDPLGAPRSTKIVSSTIVLVGVIGLLAWAFHRLRCCVPDHGSDVRG